MAENFDIAKFLKENALGSYGILGNYVDLKPLKEDDGSGFSGKISLDYYDHPSITNSFQKRAVKAFQKYIASEFNGTATVLKDSFDEIIFQLSGLQGVSSIEDVISAYKKMRADEMNKDFLDSGGPFSILASWMVSKPEKYVTDDSDDDKGWGNDDDSENKSSYVTDWSDDEKGWGDDEFIVEKKSESKDKKVDVYNADEIIYMGEEPLMVDKKTTIKKGDALDSDKLVDDDTKYRRAILSVDGPQFKYKNQMYILYDIDPEDDRYGFDDDDDYESGGRSIHLTKSLDEKKEDLGGWDGNKKYNQYNGQYDDEFGPAIANENVEQEGFDRMMGLIDQSVVSKLPLLKKAVDKARSKGLSDDAIFNMLSSNSLVSKSIGDLIDDGFDSQDIVDFFATDFNMMEEGEGEYISAKNFDYMSDDQLDAAEASGDLKPSTDSIGPNEDVDTDVDKMKVWGVYHSILEFLRDKISTDKLNQSEVDQLRTKLEDFFKR